MIDPANLVENETYHVRAAPAVPGVGFQSDVKELKYLGRVNTGDWPNKIMLQFVGKSGTPYVYDLKDIHSIEPAHGEPKEEK